MHAIATTRLPHKLLALLSTLLLAACGQGEGPTPIPGTPAPPPPPPPPSLCDTVASTNGGGTAAQAVSTAAQGFCVDFEDDPSSYDFGAEGGFGGGASDVIDNPDQGGINVSLQTARMQKFAGDTFGGSTLSLESTVDFTAGEAFRMKVWATRSVPVTFKFEDAISGVPENGKERVLNHSGSGTWEELCFDFSGDTAGFTSSSITFIFDNGVVGDAAGAPADWTFYFDEIVQVDSCPELFPVDFEGDPASYNFGPEGGFGGGASDVIANPDATGLNTTAQTARMQKFAGETFGGSTLALGGEVDFAKGAAFRMKVWASREVPVLFKFEDAVSGLPENGKERTLNHSGSGTWEELCFDFSGDTTGFSSTSITFIFDNGVVGDATNNPDSWTFYFDEIEQVASCGTAPPPTGFPIDFEADPTSYDFGADGGFGGGASDVIANPDATGLNTTSQTARMQKFAGETFGGSTLSLGSNVDFAQGAAFRMKVWASREVPVLFKFEDAVTGLPENGKERTLNHSGSGSWEELCFDFSGDTAGFSSNAITFIFDNGVAGDAANDAGNWTFYFDEIEQAADCGTTPPPTAFARITFDDPAVTYTLRGFGGAEDSTVQADPDNAANNVAQVNRSDAAQTFAGTVVSTGPNETVGVIPLDAGNTVMSVRVRAPAAGIPIRLKIEDSADATVSVETEVQTTVANAWETLSFDFANNVTGTPAFDEANTYDKIAIFPNFGVDGATAGAQTYYFDDIDVGAGTPPPSGGTSIDFEGDPAQFDFGPDGGFGGGVSTVITNPDPSGINTSGQVVQMQKFAGEIFGGSTLALPEGVDWSQGEAFTMKVWSQRQVPVLMKLEGLNQERTDDHDGGSAWQELCFDFSGATSGEPVTGFTIIFDLGVAGDAANDPDNWTFYYDDIEQASGCPTAPPPAPPLPVDFEGDPASYTFGDFNGGVATVIANPQQNGINTTAQTAQMVKGAGETFGGSTLSLTGNVDFTAGEAFLVKVWASREVPLTYKLEDAISGDPANGKERVVSHSGSSAWEELCFDFSGDTTGFSSNAITFIFDNGTVGDVENNPNDWTFYFDEITQVANCPTPPAGAFPVDFEADPASYSFGDFGGGVATVIANAQQNGINTSAQTAQMQKFAGDTFGGSTLSLSGDVDFAGGTAFRMKVWASRAVPVTFKFEDAISGDPNLGKERVVSHSGSSSWEELCFDFTGDTGGFQTNAITFIFDNGVSGDAANNPGDWTFLFDEIEQAADCGIPPAAFPIDFEADPGTYDFGVDGGFGGGAADVIANPDATGLNTTAQTARMRKFAGEVFGGSTLALGGNVDFSQGTAFRMKVWSARAVPVLFKFEGLNKERTRNHLGGSTWQELCFDFTGDASGPTTNAITFIFDNGVAGDAAGNPTDWTFYFDEIEQVAGCPTQAFPVDFEAAAASYDFGPTAGFAGGVATVISNPQQTGGNTSAQTAQMQKFAGESFGGATLSLGVIDFADGEVFTMKVWASRSVPVLFKFETLNQERTLNHSGSSAWEELCFDFTSTTTGPSTDKITFIFDNGVVGDALNNPDDWTFYFDDIQQATSCPQGATSIDFESGSANFTNFEGGVSTVIANPDPSGINTSSQVAEMQKFAGQPFGGTTIDLGGPVAVADGDTYRMKVRASRAVDVTLKLETQGDERVASHNGSGTWEELCFDFTGVSGTITGLTVIFDNGVVGDATNDAANWTFQYDDIELTSSPCPAATWETITFDDSGTTYTLTDFAGTSSTITNDPAGGINQVVTVVKSATAETFAGTTVSTMTGDKVPVLPLTAERAKMSVRTYSPDAGITVRFKIEDAFNPGVFVEVDQATTVANDWETLVFDFANDAVSQAFNPANTYNRATIFFNFGVDGATAGEKTYYYDDISVGFVPENVAYATDPNVAEDLVPPGGIQNFGSGAVFDPAFAGDSSFSPVLQTTSGDAYEPGVVDVGFAAFTGYADGFAAGFQTLEFKVKADPANLAQFEVKFFGADPADDRTVTYDLTTFGESVDIGNGWYQVSIPLSNYADRLTVFSGFLLGPLGDRGAPFTFLLTDIGFSGAGGGPPPSGGTELLTNGGFESGVLDPWVDVGNGQGTITVTSADASEGVNSVNIVAITNQTVFLRQSGLGAGSIASGDTINISFDLKGTATDVPVLPELEGSGVLETITSVPADWTTYTYTVVLGADFPGGVFFQLGVPCGPPPTCSADIFIDNVSVTGP